MENRSEIGKAIKSKLTDLDKNPSDFVWSKIETDLNKKRNRRIASWLIPSGAAFALLSLLFYYTFDFQDKNQKQEVSAKKELKSEVPNSKSKQIFVKSAKSNQKLQKLGAQEITTIKKTKSVKLVKESSKLISTTNEYEVVKKYKVVIKKEPINTKPIHLNATKKTSKSSIGKNNKIALNTNKNQKGNSSQTIKHNSKKQYKKLVTKPLLVEKTKKIKVEKAL